jgi:hypothetical protein
VLLFSAVLLGVGIHHLVATGTCSSTGYSANYGPVPRCPAGTGWWFAFVFGGIIGSLIGALMAGSLGLVFAGIFGAIGFGALSILFDSNPQSGTKVFSAVFGGCFAFVGLAAGVAVIASAARSLRVPSGKSTMRRPPPAPSVFATPRQPSAFGSAAKDADPILSAYTASLSAPPSVPPASPPSLASGHAAVRAAPGSPVDGLAKLADLHQKGELTDQEFANAKAKLLELM